jgi:cysteine-rich repeat protein
VVSTEAVGDYTVSICQDGIRTREEECDDGVGGGQGCSVECTTEIGWVCQDTAYYYYYYYYYYDHNLIIIIIIIIIIGVS